MSYFTKQYRKQEVKEKYRSHCADYIFLSITLAGILTMWGLAGYGLFTLLTKFLHYGN